MRLHSSRALLSAALVMLTSPAAWAFDVAAFLAAGANPPQAALAEAEADAEMATATQTALMPPWEMGLRQEGIGPTDPGNQVTYLTWQAGIDPFGQRASLSRSQTLHAESLKLGAAQYTLDQQREDLGQAWRVLSLRQQVATVDAALAGLPPWQQRIRLRVAAGKLPGMMLARLLGIESDWRSQRLALQRELAAAEAPLTARGLLKLVDGPLPPLAQVPRPAAGSVWPEALALQQAEKALQAAEEAVSKQAIPQTTVNVEGQRYETFARGQHTIALALGWNLPNARHLELERERIAHQRRQLLARQRAQFQRRQSLTGQFTAMYRSGTAEMAEISEKLLPVLDQQARQTQSLIERGLSDIWPWVDLRRTHLDAQLRAIEAHAAALEGGYGLWLLTAGSSQPSR